MIKLGDKVKDSITGISGIAIARCEYLYGCVQIGVEYAKDGAPETTYFDEQRLDKFSDAVSGGPQASPSGRSHPPS